MEILSPARLFAEAASTPLSAQDQATIESVAKLKETDPNPSDNSLHAIIQAAVKHAMRRGRKDLWVSISETCRSAAALHVLAQQWRNAGFDAEANPEQPWWCPLLLITPSSGIRLRWNLAELAAEVAAGTVKPA
jgi:hypothetical protein